MFAVVTESQLPGKEKGWYVIKDNVAVTGPYDFFWEANQRMRRILSESGD